MKTRLFYRIFSTYLAIMTLTLVVAGFFLFRGIAQEETERTHEELLSLARVMAGMPAGDLGRLASSFAGTSRTRITLIDAAGGVVVDSEANARGMENHLDRIEIQQAQIRGQGMAVRHSQTLGLDMLYVAVPLKKGAEIAGYLRLARPLVAVQGAVKKMAESLALSLFIIIALALLIALALTWRLLSPIRKIADFARRVRAGEAPGTLLVDSRGEIGQLAKDVDAMVTDLQKTIASAREEKGKLEAAFAGMLEGVIILDRHDRIETVNRGMIAILGGRCGPLRNKTPLEAFRNVELRDALERFKKTGAAIGQEIVLGGNPPLVLDVNISAVADLPAGDEKTIMVFHDVTRLNRLETIRADFVANVTHEIKTPLTAIIGFTETLERGAAEDRETARKFLHSISENAQRLNRLVDDLLTLSGIELGDLALNPTDVSLAEVIGNALMTVEGKATEKGVTLRREDRGPLPAVRGDRDRILQVLLNILDNAVKFTPREGTVTIEALPAEENWVVIKIADTGAGIPPSDIPRLGERFYRVDRARSRELGGTGLGLSIVKHLMKRMDGRIEIASRLGAGTTVLLFFPVSAART